MFDEQFDTRSSRGKMRLMALILASCRSRLHGNNGAGWRGSVRGRARRNVEDRSNKSVACGTYRWPRGNEDDRARHAAATAR